MKFRVAGSEGKIRGDQGDVGNSGKVVLRFTKDLGKDGMIDPTTNRNAKNIDTYILKGDGEAECTGLKFK
jgi:hypothetical protein